MTFFTLGQYNMTIHGSASSDMTIAVDGSEVDLSQTVAYKGMMLSGVPNYVFSIGYTNSSWTLKLGLLAQHFCRMLDHMDSTGAEICVPETPDADMPKLPLLKLGSGYVKRAVQKGTGELPGESYEEITYEGYAPGGVAVMARVLTDNRNRTAPEIRHVFEKHGGHMGAAGAVAWMFERKGLIHVETTAIAEDDLLALVLDAGAVDMRQIENTYEIVTPPAEMEAVRGALEGKGVPVVDAEVVNVPQSTVRVEGKDAQSVLKLTEALEDLDDVQSVHANFDIPEEVMEAISAA